MTTLNCNEVGIDSVSFDCRSNVQDYVKILPLSLQIFDMRSNCSNSIYIDTA